MRPHAPSIVSLRVDFFGGLSVLTVIARPADDYDLAWMLMRWPLVPLSSGGSLGYRRGTEVMRGKMGYAAK